MKLLVSDFDGTYYTDDISIYKNNEEISKWIADGNLFMLSSGRSFKSLKEMTKRFNIKYDYLSCCDGSILYDNNDNIIAKFNLNNNILNKFLNLKKYSKIEKIQFSYQDDYYPIKKEGELIGCNLVVKNIDITNKFLENFYLLQKNYPEYDFLRYAHEEITYFCLKNKGINKSSTIKILKDKLDLDYNSIYVVGDNDNDYIMLKDFNGYYIGNVNNNIQEICKKGYNFVYELILDIKKNG